MMDRRELLREKVRDDAPSRELMVSLKELVEYYGAIHGFMAGHLYEGVNILREAVKNSELRFLSFPANIVSTGLRGLLARVLKDGFFNMVITTCGTIDHDIAKAFGDGYYKGSFYFDDGMLHDLEIHRLGNILIPVENYGPVVEKIVRTVMEKNSGRKLSGHEVLWEIGSMTSDENSILRAAYERKIPVIVPGYFDGSFGTNAYIHSRLNNVVIDLALDQKLMEDTIFEHSSNKSFALIIGGGISKHHTIWWNQFKDGLDYTVYVTTAVEYDGSLSGAHPREAISWGKLKTSSKHVVIYGDATLVLPILLSGLYW